MNTETITNLIARLEAARGPDREIDQAIAQWEWGELAKGHFYPYAHKYTASIDASLALVERMLPADALGFSQLEMVIRDDVKRWRAYVYAGIDKLAIEEAATKPLAILLALLRALQAGAA